MSARPRLLRPKFGEALRCKAIFGHARCRWADLVLRLKVDALYFERPMIDAGIHAEFGQPLIDVLSPALAPLL